MRASSTKSIKLVTVGLLFALASWGLWWTVGTSAQEDPAGQSEERADVFSARNVDVLTVCVDSDPASASSRSAAAEQLQEALRTEQVDNEFWSDEALGARPPVVMAGCDRSFVQPPPGLAASGKEIIADEPVVLASRFPVQFFILDDGSLHVLGDRAYGRAALEMSCVGLTCAEVTTAIFVPRAALGEPEHIRSIVREVFGLVEGSPVASEYPDGHPPGEGRK